MPRPVSDAEFDAKGDRDRYIAPPPRPFNPPEPPPHRGERYKITVAARDFTGVRQGIHFYAGTGFTDDLETARRCASLNYAVTDMRPGDAHRDTLPRWKIDCVLFHGIESIRHRNVAFTDGIGFTGDKEAADFFRLGGCDVSEAEAQDPGFPSEPQAPSSSPGAPDQPRRRFKITVHVEKGDKGSFIHNGVVFTGGVGTTEDPAVADNFRHYARVEELEL